MQATPLTKRSLKQMGEEVAEAIGGKSAHPFIGTWMDRPGISIDVRLQSASDGRRIIIHKWDDEETCSVRYIFGSFWRPRPNREGVEYGGVQGVEFTAGAIATAASSLITEGR